MLVLVWLSLFVWNKVQIVCIIYMVPLMPLYLETPSSLAPCKFRLVLPSGMQLHQGTLTTGCHSSVSTHGLIALML